MYNLKPIQLQITRTAVYPYLWLDINQGVIVQPSRVSLHTSYCASTEISQEGIVPPVLLQVLLMPLVWFIHSKYHIQHFPLEMEQQTSYEQYTESPCQNVTKWPDPGLCRAGVSGRAVGPTTFSPKKATREAKRARS